MKHSATPLWRVSLSVPRQAEDATSTLLSQVFGVPSTSYTNERTQRCTISVYLEKRPDSRQATSRLAPSLRILKAADILARIPAVRVLQLEAQDWAESWKRHFRPFLAAGTFFVKPSWITRKPPRNTLEIILDPGLSFGTGHHPTTRFCLDEIAALGKTKARCSMMDLGCGSGILAIAAAKLGCRPVRAIDFDPVAVGIARANAGANHVSDRISFARSDVTKPSVRPRVGYDLVCANLLAELLESNAAHIKSFAVPGGIVLGAGILTHQFQGVRQAFEAQGLLLRKQSTTKEWTSGVFVRH